MAAGSGSFGSAAYLSYLQAVPPGIRGFSMISIVYSHEKIKSEDQPVSAEAISPALGRSELKATCRNRYSDGSHCGLCDFYGVYP